jgi:hypothetical protein
MGKCPRRSDPDRRGREKSNPRITRSVGPRHSLRGFPQKPLVSGPIQSAVVVACVQLGAQPLLCTLLHEPAPLRSLHVAR